MDAYNVMQDHEDHLMSLPNVTGVGIGEDEKGQETIVIYLSQLPEAQTEWLNTTYPNSLNGIPVVLQDAGGHFLALAER
ncbi:MAG: hypothetical protein SFZ03_02620 [Candidatus Melainabacteria bacterium]|nr:hypothetical protein [Candidatus Melainabacteria bacterium]